MLRFDRKQQNSVKQLSFNKASGGDGIPVELFQILANRACIQIFSLQVHDSRAVVLKCERAAESHRELVKAQIAELHIYSFRLKVLE